MIATERLVSEQHFHDRQARERASYFSENPDRLKFEDREYLDHAPWIRPGFEELAIVEGSRVLDYGCGHGMASVVLSRAGARVTGFDLSPEYVREARRRASANGVDVRFEVADAEQLPFANSSFDAVWGCAILHHLDLDRAAAELRRVLRPGGIAVFCEPWGGNPALNFARRFLPYPGKGHTPDERPLRRDDLKPIERLFPDLRLRGFQLLGMAARVFSRTPRAGNWLDRGDAMLLNRVPRLQNWCRYMMLTFSSPRAPEIKPANSRGLANKSRRPVTS